MKIVDTHVYNYRLIYPFQCKSRNTHHYCLIRENPYDISSFILSRYMYMYNEIVITISVLITILYFGNLENALMCNHGSGQMYENA